MAPPSPQQCPWRAEALATFPDLSMEQFILLLFITVRAHQTAFNGCLPLEHPASKFMRAAIRVRAIPARLCLARPVWPCPYLDYRMPISFSKLFPIRPCRPTFRLYPGWYITIHGTTRKLT